MAAEISPRRTLQGLGAALTLLLAALSFPAAAAPELRICADPDNLPFSNRAGEGFENHVAQLLAQQLDRQVAYTWHPVGLGFVRQTLLRGRCDVIMGLVRPHRQVAVTQPYYTSTYVLVAPSGGPLADTSKLDDPALTGVTLGVVVGAPPAVHIARAGLIGQARPYRLIVDSRHESPAGDMLRDLRAGKLDGALMWGPVGGYHALRSGGELTATALQDPQKPPPIHFHVRLAVRADEPAWLETLNTLLTENQSRIAAILSGFGIPLIPPDQAKSN